MTLFVRFTLGFMLAFMSFFLIALVLIQRGRGGGLAGAFGGAGGQSAFGTKAGDLFTRITVVVAALWILLCILAINVLGTSTTRLAPTLGGAAGVNAASETEMEPAEPETKTEPAADPEAGPGEKVDEQNEAAGQEVPTGEEAAAKPEPPKQPAAEQPPAAPATGNPAPGVAEPAAVSAEPPTTAE